MTVRFVLVRHATCAQTHEVLLGRGVDPPLSAAGRDEAELSARAIAAQLPPLDLIACSPRRRTRETAAALSRRQDCPQQTCEPLDEVDYGDWSGRRFDALEQDPRWRQWNACRASSRTPAGDSMQAVLARALGAIRSLARGREDACIAVVTHAEVVRVLLLHVLGRSPDAFMDVDVPPASWSVLQLAGADCRLVAMPTLPAPAAATTHHPIRRQELAP